MSTSILLHRLQNEFHVSLCVYVNFLFYKFKGFKAVKISNMELKIIKFRTLKSYSKNCFRISIGSELQYGDSNAANQNETQIQLKSKNFKFFSRNNLKVKKKK